MLYIRSAILRSKFLLVILLPALIGHLSGCAIHYKGVANNDIEQITYSLSNKVTYKIKDLPVFTSGGIDAINKAFKSSPIFGSAEQIYEDSIPEKGIFILVEPKYKAPDMPAIIFGYVSVVTLTLLPAWSNHDGFNIFYHVYKDGVLVKTFRYESRRFLATWIVLLPFIWANLLTTGEQEAFTSITYDFFKDAKPYLTSEAS